MHSACFTTNQITLSVTLSKVSTELKFFMWVPHNIMYSVGIDHHDDTHAVSFILT